MMADELSEIRTVTLAWLNTSLSKENLEVMIHEERLSAIKTEGMWKKKNTSMS